MSLQGRLRTTPPPKRLRPVIDYAAMQPGTYHLDRELRDRPVETFTVAPCPVCGKNGRVTRGVGGWPDAYEHREDNEERRREGEHYCIGPMPPEPPGGWQEGDD